MSGPKTIGERSLGEMRHGLNLPCPGWQIVQEISRAIDKSSFNHSRAGHIPGTPGKAKNQARDFYRGLK